MNKTNTLMILIMLFISGFSNAGDLILSPNGFSKDLKRFVFIDISQANYTIVFDTKKKIALVESTLQFEIEDGGYPLFDLLGENITAVIDGQKTNIITVNLPAVSKMLAVDKELKAGVHNLTIKHELKTLVQFESEKVRSAFWMSDLSDRAYLEQYLPTNLEYDHYLMQLDVQILQTDKEHTLMINCSNKEIGLNSWSAICPDYYTASSLFFHLFDNGRFVSIKKDYKSIDGRVIPITAYSKTGNISNFIEKAFKVMKELERDYGVWPHDQLLIYAAGRGGMEYSGATMTSMWALGHEMHHSYFARGMTPARGNAGWIDEALASWRDEGYSSYAKWQLAKTMMGAHSEYRRSTDRLAYTAGEKFVGHLNKLFKDQGGMLPFLKHFNEKNIYTSLTNEKLKSSLEQYFDTDLNELFEDYIFNTSKGAKPTRWSTKEIDHNPYHPILSKEELLDLL